MNNQSIALQAMEARPRRWKRGIWMAFLLLVSSTASAQLSITRYTIDGGGGTSENGTSKITGTIGQPFTGVASGGNSQISGGFWPGVVGTSNPTPTPTPTESGSTPTPTPTEFDFDIGGGSPDGMIDARDLLEFLSLLEELELDPQSLYQFLKYWQDNYPPAN